MNKAEKEIKHLRGELHKANKGQQKLYQENKELREELKLTYLDSKAKTVKLNEAKSRIEELEDLLFNCSCSIYKEDSESDIKYEKRVQALKT